MTKKIIQQNNECNNERIKIIHNIEILLLLYLPSQRESRSSHRVGTAFMCCCKVGGEFDADSDASVAASAGVDEDADAVPSDASRCI